MPNTSANGIVEHRFDTGQLAKILTVTDGIGYENALSVMGLYEPTPTLLVIGGASYMTDESQAKLLQCFNGPLATLSDTLGLTVLDGGTDAGVIHMMGQARHHVSGQFNLICGKERRPTRSAILSRAASSPSIQYSVYSAPLRSKRDLARMQKGQRLQV